MRIALSWLKRYLPLAGHEAKLADLLTFAGIEVEGIEKLQALGATVIAARVISAEPVPKTDHLKLCLVDIGDTEYPEKDADNRIQVICGAPNCEAGMMAVLALPGTALKDITIAKAKIRGIHSHGMLCSERELGLSENHAGIIHLPPDTPVGVLADRLFALPDTIFELEITPNRSDLLGYKGIARDLSARLNVPTIEPEVQDLSAPLSTLQLGLFNEEPTLCPRYTARVFEGVKIQDSPLWMKTALIKSGLRPINNIVDITNFVMLECGHPLHAFDYDALASRDGATGHPDIVVRRAADKEAFLALDGKNHELCIQDLVIADGKHPSALAGVMGSKDSGINPETKNIVLESAAFHPGTIRKTSYDHKISSDSSYRFERHLSPRYAREISERATALILDLGGVKAMGNLLDSYPSEDQEIILGVRPSRFKLLIGMEIDPAQMKDILQKLGFAYIQDAAHQPGLVADLNQLAPAVTAEQVAQYYRVPGYRKDVTREADILEELARLIGYDKVPQRTVLQQVMDRHAYRIQKKAAEWIVAWGAYETLNYSFTDPAQMQSLGLKEEDQPYIHLINPQSSNQSVMRVSLVPQLLTNLAYNINHAERDVKLFELGKVYLKNAKGHTEPKHMGAICTGAINEEHYKNKLQAVDFAWAKGCFEGLLQHLGLSPQAQACSIPYLAEGEAFAYELDGKHLGCFGRIQSPVLEAWGIDATNLKQEVWLLLWDIDALASATRSLSVTFVNIPKHPAVVRDLSFLLSDAYTYGQVRQQIVGLEPALVRDVQVFDEYRSKQIPEGFRSLSLHIVLQDQEKTLTDERVDALMTSVQKTLSEKYNITMR
jgi:phenylalanyl-tRNA synthetase beta chain